MMKATHYPIPPLRTTASRVYEALNNPNNYWITRPLLAFIATRIIIFIGAYLAEVAIPNISSDTFYHVNPDNVWLDVWARWDSAFYLRIVDSGYWFIPGEQSAVAFFPLYPLLVSLLEPVTGALLGGILVSNALFFGALVFLYQLTVLEFKDPSVASRTIFYIAAFPTAFFFSAVYTESTFLFFTVATLYFARRRLWAWAVLFGFLCASSRIVGIVMWGVVGLEWMESHGWTLTTIFKPQAWRNLFGGIRKDWFNLVLIFLIPLGLLSYMVFLQIQFNDPIAFSTTQSAWGREMLGPLVIIYRDLASLAGGNFFTGDIWWHVTLDLSAYFGVLVIAIAIWRRLGASYALFCIISILIPSFSGTGSLSRYALVIFPVFMMLGYWGRYQWLDRIILVVSCTLLGILTTLFVNWVFVA